MKLDQGADPELPKQEQEELGPFPLNKVTETPYRHSRVLLAGIQPSANDLDSRRGHAGMTD